MHFYNRQVYWFMSKENNETASILIKSILVMPVAVNNKLFLSLSGFILLINLKNQLTHHSHIVLFDGYSFL